MWQQRTGNDCMNTMLDIGKTAIIMQYLNEEYDDEPRSTECSLRYNEGKPDFSLIPMELLCCMARKSEYGPRRA